MINYKQPVIPVLVLIVYIVAAESLVLNFLPGVSVLFCCPTAWLTHVVTGWPLSMSDGVYVLETPAIILRITEKCSGFSFFLTLHGVILLALAFKNLRLMIISILPVLAASYVMAILLNVCRVMCSYQLKNLLPDGFIIPYAGIHLFIGAMIFIPFLILAFMITTTARSQESGVRIRTESNTQYPISNTECPTDEGKTRNANSQ